MTSSGRSVILTTDHKGDVIAVAAREAIQASEGDLDIAAAIMASAATADALLREALTGDGLAHSCRVAVQAIDGARFGG